MRTNPLSSLEALELRVAPANATAVLAGGLLSVTPIDPLLNVELDFAGTGPGAFDVFEGGELLGSFTGVTALDIQGTNHADSITIEADGKVFRGDIVLRGGTGTGSDVVLVDAIDVRGDFTARLAHGEVLFDPDARVRGDVTVRGADASVRVQGDLGSLTARVSSITLEPDGAVNGPLLARGYPDGILSLITSPGSVIGGMLDVIHHGGESTDLQLAGLVFGRTSLVMGDGPNNATFTGTHNKSVLLRSGAGPEEVRFNGADITGRIDLLLGDGDNFVSLDQAARLRGDVQVLSGSAAVSNHFGMGGASQIDGDLLLRFPSGENNVIINIGTILGDVVHRGSPGTDSFAAAIDGHLFGTLKLILGEGNNNAGVDDPGTLRALRYVSGAGNDTLFIDVYGGEFLRVNASLGDGSDLVTLQNENLLSANIDGGLGTDEIRFYPSLSGPNITFLNFDTFTQLP